MRGAQQPRRLGVLGAAQPDRLHPVGVQPAAEFGAPGEQAGVGVLAAARRLGGGAGVPAQRVGGGRQLGPVPGAVQPVQAGEAAAQPGGVGGLGRGGAGDPRAGAVPGPAGGLGGGLRLGHRGGQFGAVGGEAGAEPVRGAHRGQQPVRVGAEPVQAGGVGAGAERVGAGRVGGRGDPGGERVPPGCGAAQRAGRGVDPGECGLQALHPRQQPGPGRLDLGDGGGAGVVGGGHPLHRGVEGVPLRFRAEQAGLARGGLGPGQFDAAGAEQRAERGGVAAGRLGPGGGAAVGLEEPPQQVDLGAGAPPAVPGGAGQLRALQEAVGDTAVEFDEDGGNAVAHPEHPAQRARVHHRLCHPLAGSPRPGRPRRPMPMSLRQPNPLDKGPSGVRPPVASPEPGPRGERPQGADLGVAGLSERLPSSGRRNTAHRGRGGPGRGPHLGAAPRGAGVQAGGEGGEGHRPVGQVRHPTERRSKQAATAGRGTGRSVKRGTPRSEGPDRRQRQR
ncbi:hypothetical protein ACFQXA_22860 [Nocardiopsis composta]